MMQLQVLQLLQILIICAASTFSYPNPIYGTKRYGRSVHQRTSYDPYSYKTIVPSQRYPLSYYKLYPYRQSYPEEYYYPQESYPVYYPPARTSKYEIYQAVLPYYYQEPPISRPGYNYYGYNGVQDEMMQQEVEREEREEAQPIGHESFYENEADDTNYSDVNAAFLQNLILSQMYQDSLDNERVDYDGYNVEDDSYDNAEEIDDKPSYVIPEDENVRDLKQLQKQSKTNQRRKQTKNNAVHWSQMRNRQNNYENKRSNFNLNNLEDSFHGSMVYTDRKPVFKPVTIKPDISSSSIEQPKRESRGQKEEFQMRPATPVRHPFASPVLAMLSTNSERKREPSVYDTIKHMLDLEKSLEKNQAETGIRPSMKKRIITSDESLARQLSVLKKAQ